MDILTGIDFGGVASRLLQLGVAFLLALPVALDREHETRTLGLRTFPLVAIASAGYIQIGQAVLGPLSTDLSRLLQGLMTGVGFLGGGAILKDGGTVRGTATAASLWSTSGLGAAVAFSRYDIAIALSVANLVTLRWLKSIRPAVQRDEEPEDEADDLTENGA